MSSAENAAATRIQAIQRGKSDRVFVAERKRSHFPAGGEGKEADPGEEKEGQNSVREGFQETSPVAPEWPSYCNPEYVMPQFINVSSVNEQGQTARFQVEVEKFAGSKAYLGGYRHKQTGLVYHHATSQTNEGLNLRRGWVNPENKTHRDTQTYETKTRSQMTTREHGTQMERKDLLIDASTDTTKVSHPYFSANQLMDLKRRKTLVIQCYYRGYLARKHTWMLRERLFQEYVESEARQERQQREIAERRQHEVERRRNPQTAKDFELLYNELEAWVKEEVAKLRGLEATEKKLHMNEILAKQTRALQTIDKLKAKALTHGKERKTRKMLDLMAQPKRWELGNGDLQEVHTQFTVRAAELRELYEALVKEGCSIDERLDILLNVKWTAKEFDCSLSRDIVSLCDREAEMLNRGRNESTLIGLRRRLSNLFLQFIETPDFNPESMRFLRVPVDSEAQRLMSVTM